MKLITESITEVNGEYWFMERRFNAVFSLNPIDGKITYRCSIPEETVNAERLAVKLLHFENKIYFVPMCTEKLWTYSLEDGSWESYEVFSNFNGKISDRASKFFNAFINNRKLYLMGTDCPYWTIFDLDLKSVKHISFVNKDFDVSEESNTTEAFYRYDYAFVDNKVYRACCKCNEILVFDIDTEKFLHIKVGSSENTYSGIAYDGTSFWLAPRKNTPVVRWTPNEKWIEYDICRDFSKDKLSLLGAVYLDKKIIMPAMNSDFSIEIAKENVNNIRFINEQFFFFEKLESGVAASLDKSKRLKIWSADGNVMEYEFDISMSEIPIIQELQKEMSNRISYEDELFGLSDWIDVSVAN